MWIQKEITLKPRSRGFHLVTEEILSQLPDLRSIKIGVMNVFIKHTSASLTINENAAPEVRLDFESYFNHTVPENEPYYRHLDEGSDDLPAHLKSSILGCSLNIPVTSGRPNLGIWQGIYFCEHRNYGGSRVIVVTINGE
ncbi:secondary thiamine-phosphate synthase enzyme YjbQ [Methyloglobulus sp.]|uniref:secondary thiamine-phosphate synthase enzyme YjbQ n=1 Tax=Methyloglobulus sp. TaxID=2518622 RepID=UPI0039892511